jgi:hypothetical protein
MKSWASYVDEVGESMLAQEISRTISLPDGYYGWKQRDPRRGGVVFQFS